MVTEAISQCSEAFAVVPDRDATMLLNHKEAIEFLRRSPAWMTAPADESVSQPVCSPPAPGATPPEACRTRAETRG
jgi:hypothetical protein